MEDTNISDILPKASDCERSIVEALSTISAYVSCDLDAFCSELSLLSKLNDASLDRYCEVTSSLIKSSEKLQIINSRCADLKPSLDKIKQFDSAIVNLERTAERLALKSKDLEQRSLKYLDED